MTVRHRNHGPTSIPDAIEPVHGWRAFELRDLGSLGYRLGSTTRSSHYWAPGTTRARCYRVGFPLDDHQAPEEDCACGLYAVTSPERVPWQDRLGVLVGTATLATVDLWGKVIAGQRGWRAQYGRATGLYLPPGPGMEAAEAIGSGEGIPVMTAERFPLAQARGMIGLPGRSTRVSLSTLNGARLGMEEAGLALSKGLEELLEAVNGALDGLARFAEAYNRG